MTETLLLAIFGGIGGAILAWWGKDFMLWLPARKTPIVDARIHDGSLPCWEPQHEVFPPPGEDGAADPPEYGEEQGFGHQLPNHSPAARAECQTRAPAGGSPD